MTLGHAIIAVICGVLFSTVLSLSFENRALKLKAQERLELSRQETERLQLFLQMVLPAASKGAITPEEVKAIIYEATCKPQPSEKVE